MSEASFTDRKMCPQCGHSNRITAKVCTNCGYSFADMTWGDQPNTVSGVQGVPLKRCPECGNENRVSAKVCNQCGHRFRVGSSGQKWCPSCGTVNRLEAKVCIHCGHHFRTNFTGEQVATLPADTAKKSTITEPPVIQAPEAPIQLPTLFESPPRLPDPPVVQTPTAVSPPPARTPTDELNLDGEPAPELTDDDFDTMQRNQRKKDHR